MPPLFRLEPGQIQFEFPTEWLEDLEEQAQQAEEILEELRGRYKPPAIRVPIQ